MNNKKTRSVNMKKLTLLAFYVKSNKNGCFLFQKVWLFLLLKCNFATKLNNEKDYA